MKNNQFSSSQVLVRLTKRAELLANESRGLFIGKRQVATAKEVHAEIERRIAVNPQWAFEV